MRSIVLFVCILLLSRMSAQYSDSIHYYTGYTSTGTFNKTNDNNSYLINNTLKLGARHKDITFNSNSKWLYGKQNEDLTNNDISSVWDVNLYKTLPHFYYWGLFNYNSTYSLKVNSQVQTGAGIAYNIIDRKNFTVNVSDGILYEYSDLILEDTTWHIYDIARNSFRLQIKWNIKDVLVFSGTGFLQNSLRDERDYIIKSDLSLAVKLRKWLSLTSSYSFNKMSKTNTENSFLTYGIFIEKYF
jgi:hypothetical protein